MVLGHHRFTGTLDYLMIAEAPEPSTIVGAAKGVLMFIGHVWRKRRRARLAAA